MSLAGASPPSPQGRTQGGSQKVRNCRGRGEELLSTTPAAPCPCTLLTLLPEKLKNHGGGGGRIRVSPGPQRSKLFLDTVKTKGGFLCSTMQQEVRRWLLVFTLRVGE